MAPALPGALPGAPPPSMRAATVPNGAGIMAGIGLHIPVETSAGAEWGMRTAAESPEAARGGEEKVYAGAGCCGGFGCTGPGACATTADGGAGCGCMGIVDCATTAAGAAKAVGAAAGAKTFGSAAGVVTVGAALGVQDAAE